MTTPTTVDFERVAARFVSVYALSASMEKALAELLATRPLKTLGRDDVLFGEHDLGLEMYMLLEGRIVASRKDVRGMPIRIAGIDAPSIVGHMGVIEGATRNATCTVRRDGTVVAMIDRTTYAELMTSTGPRGSVFRHLLLAAMSEQLSAANDRVRTLIDPRTIGKVDDETTESGIHDARDALSGYHEGDRGGNRGTE